MGCSGLTAGPEEGARSNSISVFQDPCYALCLTDQRLVRGRGLRAASCLSPQAHHFPSANIPGPLSSLVAMAARNEPSLRSRSRWWQLMHQNSSTEEPRYMPPWPRLRTSAGLSRPRTHRPRATGNSEYHSSTPLVHRPWTGGALPLGATKFVSVMPSPGRRDCDSWARIISSLRGAA